MLTDVCACGAPVSMMPKDHVCEPIRTPPSEAQRLHDELIAKLDDIAAKLARNDLPHDRINGLG